MIEIISLFCDSCLFVSYLHVKSELFMRAMIYFNRYSFICNKVATFCAYDVERANSWIVNFCWVCFVSLFSFIAVIKFEWLLAKLSLNTQTPFITIHFHFDSHFLRFAKHAQFFDGFCSFESFVFFSYFWNINEVKSFF